MELLAFAVFDRCAAAFITPWFLPTEAMAVRAFVGAVKSEGHEFNRHPEDYTLMRVARFSTDTGAMVGEVNGPQVVMTGVVAAAVVAGEGGA